MGKILLFTTMCLILPLLLLLIYLEKRGRRLVISLICGVLAGFLSAYLNGFMQKLFNANDDLLKYVLAPIDEEILKFIPVLLLSLLYKKGRRGSTANAYAVGLGFCITENLIYVFNMPESASVFWIIARCVGTGLMHSMTTSIEGVMIYKARETEKVKVLWIVLGLVIGISFHMLYNILVNNVYLKVIGALLPIIVYIIILIIVKKENIHKFLYEEKEETEK